MTVYKYALDRFSDVVDVVMPKGAEILTVAFQDGVLRAWARVDPRSNNSTTRRFRICGTGHPNALGKFVCSVFEHEGALVWHVFDLGEIED